MKKTTLIIAGVVAVATTGFSPAASAKKHKVQAMMAAPANPRMNSSGEFYATPMQAGMEGMGVPGLEVIPVAGGVATGAVNGAGEVVNGAGNVVNGVTAPLLAPLK